MIFPVNKPAIVALVLLISLSGNGFVQAETANAQQKETMPDLPNGPDTPLQIPPRDVPADAPYSAYQMGHYLTAFSLATERAAQGDVAAQTLLGELYNRGLGIAEDPSEAAKWFELAAEGGDREAQFAIGLLYAQGRGVAKDLGKAAQYFEKAAAAGQKNAQFNLAFLYLQGEHFRQDLTRAFDLFTKAAKQGLPDAQYALASLHRSDFYPTPNMEQASYWMQQAAENGYVDAQLEFGLMLFNGTGVAQDRPAARAWLEKAANQGSILAQNRLARILAQGFDQDPDPIGAAQYYLLSRKAGKKDDWLERYYESLSAEQKSSALQNLQKKGLL